MIVQKMFAIARKDAMLRFASRSELLFFIILPLVFTFLLAGGTPSEEDDERIRLAVVDQAGSDLSRSILAELDGSSAVRPELLSLEEANDQFDQRRALVLLIIPPGLDEQALLDGRAEVEFRQQPGSVNAVAALQAVRTALRSVTITIRAGSQAVSAAESIRPFVSAAERASYYDEAALLAATLQSDLPALVSAVAGATADRVDYDPRANSSAGQLITWVFIPLFGISALFAYERQRGTLRRILTTPTRQATFLVGTIAGQVVLALIQMSLLVAFGALVMKLQWGRDPLALAAILTASALAAAAIGTAMGTFVKSEGQANGLSIMAGMVMALLGGCWYPLELFPAAVQSAVRVLPTTWAMQGMLDLVLRGGGLADIVPETAVLLGFAALFLAVGVWRFRYE